jgi:proteasome lid subunit RPN8/RPN11
MARSPGLPDNREEMATMLRVTPEHLREVRSHGEEAVPFESCGALVGGTVDDVIEVLEVIRCENAAPAASRQHRYSIDPRRILEIEKKCQLAGQQIVGFYHSHVDHPAEPSSIDLDEAHWFGCVYLISAVKTGAPIASRAFLLVGESEQDKRFVELALNGHGVGSTQNG